MLAWCRVQEGTVETPAGSNLVPYWGLWHLATGQPIPGGTDPTQGRLRPWCGTFAWAALHAGGWTAPADFVSVWAIEEWARAHGRYREGAGDIIPGDVLILLGHGQHCGIARTGAEYGQVATVEGNTSSGSAGSQDNGGGVFARLRPAPLVVGRVRVADLLGDAGPITLTPPAPAAPATSPGGFDVSTLPTLSQGATGNTVRACQRLVGVTCDGQYGPITAAAVRAFQQSSRITVDGVVGPVTWSRLLGV